MTHKQRVHAALAGAPLDRFPAAFLYNMLYFEDHFAELTGQPAWHVHHWQHADPDAHLDLWDTMLAQAPVEILQPQYYPSREDRANITFSSKDGRVFRHDRRTRQTTDITPVTGHARDYADQETRKILTPAAIPAHVKVTPAEAQIASGRRDLLDALVRRRGPTEFILSGGVIGTLYSCSRYVGLTNLFAMLEEEKPLVHELSQRILEQNIEAIRFMGSAGGDAIYIDDATATSDMISPAHYEEFCLPYLKPMVDEIHRHHHKAILIYFGGIMDRLDQIASLGADGLSMETAMKTYTNDLSEIASRIGNKITLFGNVDPVGIVQNGTDEQLAEEMTRQAAAGHNARGFVHCTGSPITPATPIARVRRFLELGRTLR